jgi:hypothetical protein
MTFVNQKPSPIMGLNGLFLLIYVLLAGWGARVGTIAALLLWFVFPWGVFF